MYKLWNGEDAKTIQVVLRSADRSDDQFKNSISGASDGESMPWVAAPYPVNDAPFRERFTNKTIPWASILNGTTGEIIELDAKEAVRSESADAVKSWLDKC